MTQGRCQEMVGVMFAIIGKNTDMEQLYPSYEDFQTELRARFWKDADAQIKHAQWEKLRQSNFQDGDQFFQKFEELAYDAGICDNKQVMLAQVKRAVREKQVKNK